MGHFAFEPPNLTPYHDTVSMRQTTHWRNARGDTVKVAEMPDKYRLRVREWLLRHADKVFEEQGAPRDTYRAIRTASSATYVSAISRAWVVQTDLFQELMKGAPLAQSKPSQETWAEFYNIRDLANGLAVRVEELRDQLARYDRGW